MYYAFHLWSLGLNPLRKGFSFRFLQGHEYFTHGKGESAHSLSWGGWASSDCSVALIFKRVAFHLLSAKRGLFGQGLAPLGNKRDMDWSKALPVHGDVLLMSWHLPCGPPGGLLTSITHTHRLVNLIILSPISWCLTFHHGNDGRLFIFTLQAS